MFWRKKGVGFVGGNIILEVTDMLFHCPLFGGRGCCLRRGSLTDDVVGLEPTEGVIVGFRSKTFKVFHRCSPPPPLSLLPSTPSKTL